MPVADDVKVSQKVFTVTYAQVTLTPVPDAQPVYDLTFPMPPVPQSEMFYPFGPKRKPTIPQPPRRDVGEIKTQNVLASADSEATDKIKAQFGKDTEIYSVVEVRGGEVI